MEGGSVENIDSVILAFSQMYLSCLNLVHMHILKDRNQENIFRMLKVLKNRVSNLSVRNVSSE